MLYEDIKIRISFPIDMKTIFSAIKFLRKVLIY